MRRVKESIRIFTLAIILPRCIFVTQNPRQSINNKDQKISVSNHIRTYCYQAHLAGGVITVDNPPRLPLRL